MLSADGEVADIPSQLLAPEGLGSIADAATKSGAIYAQTLSAIMREMSEGQVDIPHEDIESSIQM